METVEGDVRVLDILPTTPRGHPLSLLHPTRRRETRGCGSRKGRLVSVGRVEEGPWEHEPETEPTDGGVEVVEDARDADVEYPER